MVSYWLNHTFRLIQDGKSRDRKKLKFNQMIPGQFSFHYDTQQFERMIKTLTQNITFQQWTSISD